MALDVRWAIFARQLQTTVGNPTTKDFLNIIEKIRLKGYGTTRKDILIAEDIFVPSGSGLKGKTTTPVTTHVREDIIPVPDDNYRDVYLGVDILFINGVPFLTTISLHLYFTTVGAIINAEEIPSLNH